MRSRRTARKTVIYVVTGIAALLYILPIYLIVLTSLKSRENAFQTPPTFFTVPTFEAYIQFFQRTDVLHMLGNSLIVALGSTALAFVLGVPAAYGLARFQGRMRDGVGLSFLASRFIPPIAVVVPYFLGLRLIGGLDTQWGLVLVYLGMNLPYVVWMMRGFFLDLPVEIEEAALVDGCTRFGTMVRIVLPIAKGGLAATAVLTLMFAWNEFLFALLLTSSRAATLPLSISAFLGESGTEWNVMAAAGTLIMLPAIVFSVFVQKHMARGLTFGAVK